MESVALITKRSFVYYTTTGADASELEPFNKFEAEIPITDNAQFIYTYVRQLVIQHQSEKPNEYEPIDWPNADGTCSLAGITGEQFGLGTQRWYNGAIEFSTPLWFHIDGLLIIVCKLELWPQHLLHLDRLLGSAFEIHDLFAHNQNKSVLNQIAIAARDDFHSRWSRTHPVLAIRKPTTTNNTCYLVNKFTGFGEWIIEFTNDRIYIVTPEQSHKGWMDGDTFNRTEYQGVFDYATPDVVQVCIDWLTTNHQQYCSATSPLVEGGNARLSKTEIATIAKNLVNNSWFSSRAIRGGLSLSCVFLPLAFLGREEIDARNDQGVGMVIAPMSDAGPMAVNGYPIFSTARLIGIEDADLILERYHKLVAVLNSVDD